MSTTFVCGLAALMLGSIATAAPAAAADRPPATEAVSYGDLDLSTDNGARVLARRIRKAAQEVCRDLIFGKHDIVPARSYRDCRDAAIADAVGAVGSERLSRVALARGVATPTAANRPMARR
jgi:UrcA family protein